MFYNSRSTNRMSIVWYALAIYIVGIAIVLYVRPAIMFRPGGTWKEFGLSNQGSYTIFPFWMFALVWAILSYAFANIASLFLASTVLVSSNANTMNDINTIINSPNTVATPISNASNINTTVSIPDKPELPTTAARPPIPAIVRPPEPASGIPAPAPVTTRPPGYYILETIAGEPRYVYWGPEPPTSANLIVRN